MPFSLKKYEKAHSSMPCNCIKVFSYRRCPPIRWVSVQLYIQVSSNLQQGLALYTLMLYACQLWVKCVRFSWEWHLRKRSGNFQRFPPISRRIPNTTENVRICSDDFWMLPKLTQARFQSLKCKLKCDILLCSDTVRAQTSHWAPFIGIFSWELNWIFLLMC